MDNFLIPGLSTDITNSIFKKSSQYLQNDTDIVRKPNTKNGYLVPSKNLNLFHTVTTFETGKITCDKSCQNYQAFGICSHITAVARKNG